MLFQSHVYVVLDDKLSITSYIKKLTQYLQLFRYSLQKTLQESLQGYTSMNIHGCDILTASYRKPRSEWFKQYGG